MRTIPSLSDIVKSKKSESVDIEIPKRNLGKTDEQVSILAMGGVVLMDEAQSVANDAVALAFDRGVTYYDVAPAYGNAEEIMGPALKPYRDQCFLACKSDKRLRQDVEKEFNESLEKLQTDHFDLYQMHGLSSIEDVDKAFEPGGAMEAIMKARQAGKVRFIGFSAHSQEAALHALTKFSFDTVLFPINYVCWYQGNFGPQLLNIARKNDLGIIALKSWAQTLVHEAEKKPFEKCWYRPIPFKGDELANLALRFTLSKADVVVPPGEPAYFWKAMDMVSKMTSLTDEEESKLKELSSGILPIFQAEE